MIRLQCICAQNSQRIHLKSIFKENAWWFYIFFVPRPPESWASLQQMWVCDDSKSGLLYFCLPVARWFSYTHRRHYAACMFIVLQCIYLWYLSNVPTHNSLWNELRETDTSTTVDFWRVAHAGGSFLHPESGSIHHSGLAACKFSSPRHECISPAWKREWQNGVRTARMTWFFSFSLFKIPVWGTAEETVVKSPWWQCSGMK